MSKRLHENHFQDLVKSGLSEQMIEDMGCFSMSGEAIYQEIFNSDEVSSKWRRATGYVIPFRDEQGADVSRRYRMFWADADNTDGKAPKYLTVLGGETNLYVPPGFDAVYAAQGYLIVTEGEKKAAKAVQEGFPCVGLSGIDMWADSEARKTEKDNYLPMSYSTVLLKRLEKLAHGKQCLVVFDSDAEKKWQIRESRQRLKDALLFQAAEWVRQMPMPVPSDGIGQKWGIDDLLAHAGGKSLFDATVTQTTKMETQLMTPLFQLPYGTFGKRRLSYYVPNHGKYDKANLSRVLKEVVVDDDDGTQRVEYKEICSTRVWVSRVVHSVDGDNEILYELTYVPHSSRMPLTITGDAEIISITNSKEDILARRGAKVLTRFKAGLEEFLVDCQKYGVLEGTVKIAYGTKRRGWRESDEHLKFPAYVMASRIITENEVYAADNPRNSLIPIDGGSDELLRQALKVVGDGDLWRRAISTHVLPSPVATMTMAAGLAGLLRHWCSGSENFIFHIYGDSSAGKTNALRVATSAWGNPKRLIDTWKTTTNGLERRAVGRNDMGLFLDEAGMADEQELVSAIYAIGNGGEKMRATRNVGERVTSKYNLVAVSTGEKQLVRGTKFVGQEVRAVELRVDLVGPLWPTIHSSEEAEEFCRVLESNYGHAVEPLIRGILSMIGKDKMVIQNKWIARTELIRSMAVDKLPQHIMRRMKHFGLCLTVIELFLKFVLSYDEDTIEDYLLRMTRVVVEHMVQLDTDQFKEGERIGILQHFMNQLAAYQSKFFNSTRPALNTPNDLYGAIEGSLCFVIPSKLAEMMKPYDNSRMIQTVEQIDALVTKNSERKTVSHRILQARPNCYVFDLEKIESVVYKDD